MAEQPPTTDFARRHPFRILLAEDNPTNQIIATISLKNLGYEVTVVPDGLDAVEAFIAAPYDLIFMDLQMADMDGYEASRQIRQHLKLTGDRTYIVAMTAHEAARIGDECRRAGIDDFLIKPYTPATLQQVLRRAWGGLHAEGPLAGPETAAGQGGEPSATEGAGLEQRIGLALRDLCGGSSPMRRRLVETYLESSRELMAGLRRALDGGDPERLALTAHSLRSGSAGVGAEELASALSELEQLGNQRNLLPCALLIGRAEQEYRQVRSILERLREEAAANDGEPPRPSVEHLHVATNWRPADTRILVVDDQPFDRLLIGSHLTAEGYQVLVAASGDEALELVVREPPDLVLSDVLMPGTSGLDICRRIKASPQTVLIPVVLITSLDQHQNRVEGLEAGADEFLTKPVNREELLARVGSLMRYQSARKQLEAAQREQLERTVKRYIAPKLVDRILQQADGSEFALDDRQNRQEAVILFADMRGFTAMSESLEPPQVVARLNAFFTLLTDIAYRHDGTIFNMAGDCLLIGFGVPFHQEDAASRSVRVALEMQREFVSLAEQWLRDYKIEIGLGIGINRGEVIVGNVGSPNYMNYTVIGDTVNLASRIMDLARAGETILTGSMADALQGIPESAMLTPMEPVLVKGKAQPQRIYSLRIDA